MNKNIVYCDNDCGKKMIIDSEKFYISALPCDIQTANKGESACLCKKCFKKIMI